jgi:arginyl-tRNA synthetase
MHVGHLRTTIVGGTIARILDFAGHHVRGPDPARM